MIICNLENKLDWMDMVQVKFQWCNLVKGVMKLKHFAIQLMQNI